MAAANPRLKFAAWAQHPYPTPQNLKPTQKVKWPNVTMSSLARFEQSLDKWFKRKGIRIWITEFGYETKPDGEPKGVSRAQQAAYTTQAIGLAKKDPRVDMFVWFIFRDDATSVWQSGLQTKSGAAKPALARFRSAAKSVDARNPLVKVRGGSRHPSVAVPMRELATNRRSGAHGRDQLPHLPARQAGCGRPAGDDARPRRGRPLPAGGFKPAKKIDVRRPPRRQHGERRRGVARAHARRGVAPNAALIPRSTIAG